MTANDRLNDREWVMVRVLRNAGSNRYWTEQRNTRTGATRFISQTASGRNVVRRHMPKN